MKTWFCKRCETIVDYENFKCNCSISPSPWVPISSEKFRLTRWWLGKHYKISIQKKILGFLWTEYPFWDLKMFDTELDAVKFIVEKSNHDGSR